MSKPFFFKEYDKILIEFSASLLRDLILKLVILAIKKIIVISPLLLILL